MLIVNNKPEAIVTEAYKRLRTNIQYSSVSKEIKTLLITSTDPKEGKSTVCANLGLSFAQNNKSVLILDCDLRKPSLHRFFNVSNEIGLTDVIIGEEKLEDVIQNYDTNLSIITSGKIPPNPSEILGTDTMENILEFIKNKYDVVIIDSPPVGAVTDAQILSAKADGVIVVVKSGETKSTKVTDSVNLLKKVNANLIGIVMNYIDVTVKNYPKYYS